MRKARTFIVLALVTAAAVAAVVMMRQESSAISRDPEPMFPDLMDRINETAEVSGVSGSERFTLTRIDNRWVVKEKSGYPAAEKEVRQFLLGAAELKRLEPKTKNPDLYEKLGLEEPSADDAKSVRFSVKDDQGDMLANLVVGNRRPEKADSALSQIYVRAPDDPQAWLVGGSLPDHRSSLDWLEKEILSLDEGRIRAVRVVHPDGEELVVEKNDAGNSDYELKDLPEGASVDGTHAVNSVATAFTDLSLEDVKPASDLNFGDNAGLTVEIETFDGLRVNMETAEDAGQTYGRFTAVFDAALMSTDDASNVEATQDASEDQATEDGPASAKGPTPEEVEGEAQSLTERWEGWAYVLPQYRLDSFSKKKADLIKTADEQAAEEPSSEEEANATPETE